MDVKTCNSCKETKELALFIKQPQNLDGYGVCKECKRKNSKAWADKNRDKVRESALKWKQNNAEWNKSERKRRAKELRIEVLTAYGWDCACCGESTYEFLTIDHIHGGGTAHRKALHGKVYEYLRREGYPPGFQVLCWNCNAAKGLYGSCPHTLTKEQVA